MKAVIVYCSKHHGNTKKLVDAIKKEWEDVILINAVECKEADLSDFDIIGFASGIYLFNFSKEIIEFAKNNLPREKKVFLMHTHCLNLNYTKTMKKIVAEKSCRLFGTYGCRGFDEFGPLKYFGGIAKGHPNEEDVKGAVEFFRNIMDK